MISPDRQQRIAALRDSIADIERKPALAEARVSMIDHGDMFPRLAGGLLQEVFTDERRNGGAMLGFALAQARGLITSQRPAIIYLQLADEAQKLGLPYGPGLLSFGLDPDALVLVRPASIAELLWAAEEAIACKAVGAVVADIGGRSKLLDFTASRRLSMRAAGAGSSIFMLRYGEGREASAAHLRWRLSPEPSSLRRYDHMAPGSMRLRVQLERGVLFRQQSEWIIGWTENGFTSFTPPRSNPARNIVKPSVPRDLFAQLGDGLPQTA